MASRLETSLSKKKKGAISIDEGLTAIEIERGILMQVPSSLERVFLNFEALSVAKVREQLRSGDIFVDVGANFGFYSLIASQIVGAAGHVYSFEPSPSTLELLRLNTHAYGNILVIDKAVSDRSGHLPFFHTPDYVNSGTVANPPFQAADEIVKINVKAIRLDDFFPSDFEINFLKVDIQGDDLRAINGAKSLIERSPGLKILVEWAPTWMENAGYKIDDLPTALQDLGFNKLSVVDDYLQRLYGVLQFVEIFEKDPSGKRFCNLLAEKH